MEDYEVEYELSDVERQLDKIDNESGSADKYGAAGITGIALWEEVLLILCWIVIFLNTKNQL